MVYKMIPSSGALNDATALAELSALPRMMHDWVQEDAIINFILPFSLAEGERYRRKFVRRLNSSLATRLRARGQTPKVAARG